MASAPVARTATAALAQLWEAKFFRVWHSIKSVEAQLAKSGYHFSPPELGMALMRAKYLTRKGKKGGYQYIQKYPYAPEIAAAPTSKNKKSRKTK